MTKSRKNLEEIKLVGISMRTNNKLEMDLSEAKIPQIIDKYFTQNISSNIPSRKSPGITFCAYYNYETDFNGDYSYIIGEEVSQFDEIPENYTSLVIPKGNYVQFTSPRGVMPDIVIDLWKKIWNMDEKELGGKRRYTVDYEIYDERSVDPKNSIVEVNIGI